MKLLFLVQKEQRVILDRLYEGVAAHTDCDLRWLSDNEQAHLKRYFSEHVEVKRYDRIMLFLRFKKELRQAAFIRTIPNLVILEHDACQNYLSGKYRGKFSAHYRRLPSVRVIVSGAGLAERLRDEGTDAVFISKGYDQILLKNLGKQRDIELGFIGSIKNNVYNERKALLDELSLSESLLITRTESGEAYLDMLNRIRFFISADIGFGEYMIKNFEAMACGCVLFAYDQGAFENQATGFRDMENIVLYRSVEELKEKLNLLRTHPEIAVSIAKEGQHLAEKKYTFEEVGKRISAALEKPLRTFEPPGWLERIRLVLKV